MPEISRFFGIVIKINFLPIMRLPISMPYTGRARHFSALILSL